jgi:hypothetical protein
MPPPSPLSARRDVVRLAAFAGAEEFVNRPLDGGRIRL